MKYEVIKSTLPLEDKYELDGSLITDDTAFIGDIASLYSSSPTLFAQPTQQNYSIVGTLTDNDGVLSGFSDNNYAQITMPDLNTPSTWEMVAKFKINAIDSSQHRQIFSSSASNSVVILYIHKTGYLGYAIGNSSGSSFPLDTAGTKAVTTDTWYWGRIQFTGSSYVLSLSTDGVTYQTAYTYNSSSKLSYNSNYNFNIGQNRTGTERTFNGSIDLNNCYIVTDNTLLWKGTPTRTAEEAWQAEVNATGICGKFVYDSVNQTVRLPKYGNTFYMPNQANVYYYLNT